MFNFNVDTVDLGAYYRGLNQYNAGQAQQQALDMRKNQMQQQAQQVQQIQSLSQAALSGDPKALQQLAAIDPATAKSVQDIQQGQQTKLPSPKEMIDIGRSLKMIATTNPQNINPALQKVVEAYPDMAPAAQEFGNAFAQNPQSGMAMLDGFINAGADSEKTKAPTEVQTFRELTKAAGATPEEIKEAAMIELGLKPRAVGSSMQTISQDPNKLRAVSQAEAVIAGRKKEAEIISRLKLEPQLESALKSASAKAAIEAKNAQENRSNEKALSIYQNAAGRLETALTGTTTGKFVGLLPAMTSNAQIAEGAIAIMRPVIKDAVRSAGEGTFTDSDQALINQMIPTRDDSASAIKVKLQMLDSFMQDKLSTPSAGGEVTPQDVQVGDTDDGVVDFNNWRGGN